MPRPALLLEVGHFRPPGNSPNPPRAPSCHAGFKLGHHRVYGKISPYGAQEAKLHACQPTLWLAAGYLLAAPALCTPCPAALQRMTCACHFLSAGRACPRASSCRTWLATSTLCPPGESQPRQGGREKLHTHGCRSCLSWVRGLARPTPCVQPNPQKVPRLRQTQGHSDPFCRAPSCACRRLELARLEDPLADTRDGISLVPILRGEPEILQDPMRHRCTGLLIGAWTVCAAGGQPGSCLYALAPGALGPTKRAAHAPALQGGVSD